MLTPLSGSGEEANPRLARLCCAAMPMAPKTQEHHCPCGRPGNSRGRQHCRIYIG